MTFNYIQVKSGTRNHRGRFIHEAPYKLVDIDRAGWAFICVNDAICHYVDPDNLEQLVETELEEV